jgi:hypothetical protein
MLELVYNINRSIGILIIFLMVLSSLSLIDAATPNKMYFSGDGSLTGTFTARTAYIDNGVIKDLTIIDYATYADHTSTNGNIPNEAKYNDIVISQSIVGVPKTCTIILLNYNGGDIKVDYDLPTSQICKGDGDRLKVTYEGKSVEVKGGHLGYWSR